MKKLFGFTLSEVFHPAGKSRKIAFTLAEVLITLGIIGVVAALTMPVLMANYQKQRTVTQLKKAYTEIAQALKLAEIDYGPTSGWEYGTALDGESATNFANKYLIPYMNVVKNCGTDAGCIGTVYQLNNPSERYGYDDTDVGTAKLIVNSGYGIGIKSGGDYATFIIYLYTNKPKLIVGKDVFFYSVGSRGFVSNLGNKDRDDLIHGAYGCSKDVETGAGLSCGELIMKDGWQIAPDYPW